MSVAVRRSASRLNHLDFVLLSVYWIAIGYLWSSLGTLILPDLVQQLVGSHDKGKALSLLEGIGTLMAVVWQQSLVWALGCVRGGLEQEVEDQHQPVRA